MENNENRVMVTGGAGFIGSNISRELLSRGCRVVVFDNFSTGRESNLRDISDKIDIIRGDLREPADLEKAVRGIDYIFHQAALPSVPRSIRNPLASNESNVTGTLNLLIAARDSGVKRVVYASSSSVYGDTEVLPKVETMKPNPLSPYAFTKLAGEYYCSIFYKIYKLETVCLRYFNVFGPYQDPESQYAAVVPKFIKKLQNNEAPMIYGDGEQSRDFTFIKNVVDANLLAMHAPDAPGNIFNVACGKRVTVNYLAKKMAEIMGKDIEPDHTDRRQGDVRHSLADISKANKIIGYNPSFTLEEGLEQTIEWYETEG